MPDLTDVLAKTVQQWKTGADRGDVNALVRRLDATLTPLIQGRLKRPRDKR